MGFFRKNQSFDYSSLRNDAENKRKAEIDNFDVKFDELFEDTCQKIASEAQKRVFDEVEKFYQSKQSTNIKSEGFWGNKYTYSGGMYYTVKVSDINENTIPLIYTYSDWGGDSKGLCFRTQEQFLRFFDRVNTILSDYKIHVGIRGEVRPELWITAQLGKL